MIVLLGILNDMEFIQFQPDKIAPHEYWTLLLRCGMGLTSQKFYSLYQSSDGQSSGNIGTDFASHKTQSNYSRELLVETTKPAPA